MTDSLQHLPPPTQETNSPSLGDSGNHSGLSNTFFCCFIPCCPSCAKLCYTMHLLWGSGHPLHCRHAGQEATEILPSCRRPGKCGERVASGHCPGLAGGNDSGEGLSCSLLSPPSFLCSIKVCCFVKAASVVGPAPAGHVVVVGGDMEMQQGGQELRPS